MASWQRALIGALVLILLFIISLFRTELFATGLAGVWLFKVIVAGQFVLLALFISRYVKVPWWGALGVLALLEAGIWGYAAWLVDGQRWQARGRLFFQDVMDGWNKNLIQYDPDLSQYDPTLFYTLKPNVEGVFRSGLEIDTPIQSNALGLRDDSASLNHPAVILLGDSFTLGWGMPDSASFASVLERQLGRRVLNAGVSSFGTARESELLKRIQRDSCRVLVIQYCMNDQPENQELAAGTFKPSDKARYDAAVRYNALTAGYYPFKYLYAVLKAEVQQLTVKLASRSAAAQPAKTAARRVSEAEAFFVAVGRIRQLYKGPIVVTCLNPNTTGPEIIQSFQDYLNRRPMPAIYLADVSARLGPPDYFTLDNHINQSGHRKVAERLLEVIREKRLL